MWLLVHSLNASDDSFEMAIPLPESTYIIGSSDDCSLVLRDSAVSRRHVAIEVSEDEIKFKDQGSTAGTLLNGRNQDEGIIVSGDCLTIGSRKVSILHTLPKAKRKSRKRPQTKEPVIKTRSAHYPSWRPFQTFIEGLGKAATPVEMVNRLLAGLVELFGAERGFVLLAQKAGGQYRPVASHGLDDLATLVTVSSTICRYTAQKDELVYIHNSAQDEKFSQAASLNLAASPRSVLCCPLSLKQRVFGVIYLDQNLREDRPAEEELESLQSITDLASRLLDREERVQRLLEVQYELQGLHRLVGGMGKLVLGDSPASQQLKSVVEAAAPQDVPVLIIGETGAGKELVARALHKGSSRNGGPFIPLNCGALPQSLVEAELFGTEAGAFTGATKRRLGLFELARGGTILLDEVGTLPMDVQVKLLRVLQERRLRRLGGNEDISLDFRLISATNQDLAVDVQQGSFRQDLFYRLNVFRIDVPPLRQRQQDIPLLARHFVKELGPRLGRGVVELSPEVDKLLVAHNWPGNVRQLRNTIERALLCSKEDVLTVNALQLSSPQFGASAIDSSHQSSASFYESLPQNYEEASKQFTEVFLKRALERNEGNISKAAKEIGMSRFALHRRLNKLKSGAEDSAKTEE